MLRVRDPELLHEAEVHIGVPRTRKAVSANSRHAGGSDVKVACRAVGKITGSGRKKRTGIALMSSATQVADGSDGTKELSAQREAIIAGYRRPGETRMELEYAGRLPAAQGLADPVRPAAKDRKIPDTVNEHAICIVVIRRAAFGGVVRRIGLVRDETGTFRGHLVNGLAVGVREVRREVLVETMLQQGVEGIVIGVRIRSRGEHGVDIRI